MSRRRFLTVLLIIMILILAALVALFVTLRQATNAPIPVESPGVKHVRTYYGWGNQDDQLFKQPFDVTFRGGNYYVVDKGLGQVIVLSPAGQLVRKIGSPGNKPDQFAAPTGIDVDPQGNVYVTDAIQKRILVFNNQGQYEREVKFKDVPLALHIDGKRMLMTTDKSVKILSVPGLNELASWGTQGKGTEQFDHPNGIAIDPQSGTLYVSDGNNLRVKAMDQQGNVLWIYGTPPQGMNDLSPDRKFGLAGGLTYSNGYIWVADPLDSVIHVLDKKGQEVAQVGDVGDLDGQFSYPTTIIPTDGQRFSVAEWANGRLQVLEIDPPRLIENWHAANQTG